MLGNPKILVFRFSAMGDVAMLAAVLHQFAINYPNVTIVLVSKNQFKPFFDGIANLQFYTINPTAHHKGIIGLFRLFKELKAFNITAVADVHQNLRSRFLSFLFYLNGVTIKTINKGRLDKLKLTQKENKTLTPLKPMTQRYVDVFNCLGFPFKLSHLIVKNTMAVNAQIVPLFGIAKTQYWVGISAFAQHNQKIYPLNKMEVVVLSLAKLGYKLFIFGGGKAEEKIATNWQSKHINIVSVVNKLNLSDDLKLISHLDVMLSMDSAGMHLASLKGIPVISVWGATHPSAGFLGYGQSLNDTVQLDLACRPCSVYGNIPCYRGDFACMNNLPESLIIDKVIEKIKWLNNSY